MVRMNGLSSDDRELIEDACAIYMAHHHPRIAAGMTEMLFNALRATGESESHFRDLERQYWETSLFRSRQLHPCDCAGAGEPPNRSCYGIAANRTKAAIREPATRETTGEWITTWEFRSCLDQQ